MLASLGIVFLVGLLLGGIFKQIKLPSLLGMLLTGILLGPSVLGILDHSVLDMSGELRQFALVIILTRAGLALNIEDLKRVGRPAILMSFLPACFEIGATMLIAPCFFSISLLESAIMGSVLAAVSLAVVVPKMIQLMEDGYGNEHGIPSMLLASASVENVFVIVVFSSLVSLKAGAGLTFIDFIKVPVSILTGVGVGVICGLVLSILFKKVHMRDSVKVLIILSVSFLILSAQSQIENVIPMSGLIGIMSVGITIFERYNLLAKRLSVKYNKLWVAAEVLLFVLVGASVHLEYLLNYGKQGVLIVIGVLMIRLVGVWISLWKTKLSKKERIFVMFSDIPKATAQAAIGGIPLAMGFACGQQILTVAVIAILITSPLGAILIDHTHARLLNKY